MKRRTALMFILVAIATVVYGVPVLAQDHAHHYVLDAFGGVHAGGGAPAVVPATPYFGFDIAADIEFVPVGTPSAVGPGILVLDKFGGVHAGGALAADQPSGATPYFGFDVARAIVYRDISSRTVGNVGPSTTGFPNTATSFTSVVSATMIAPDDGFLLVSGSATVQCHANTDKARTRFSTNVDSTAGDPRILSGGGYAADLNCAEGSFPTDHHSMEALYPVTAGSHTAHLLYKHGGGIFVQGFNVRSPAITVTFVDADGQGASLPERGAAGEEPLRR